MLPELGEADVTLVRALEERADRGGLEEDVVLALGVQLLLPHRLHVQGFDPALVEHAAQSLTARSGPSDRP